MAEDYVVKAGDCVSSVAFERGFFWETVWNHPKNSELKEKRKDPNILKEGDVLYIPDLRIKEESRASESKHQFVLKGVPAKLRLRIMEPPQEELKAEEEVASSGEESQVEDPPYDPKPVEDQPVKNAQYLLEIDGKSFDGTTDSNGFVEISLPPNAKQGRLVLKAGTPEERAILLDLGGLDPLSETSGVRKRLSNLGFPCQSTGDEMTDDLELSVRQFQEANGLEVTGKVDDQTRDKLKQLHGS